MSRNNKQNSYESGNIKKDFGRNGAALIHYESNHLSIVKSANKLKAVKMDFLRRSVELRDGQVIKNTKKIFQILL